MVCIHRAPEIQLELGMMWMKGTDRKRLDKLKPSTRISRFAGNRPNIQKNVLPMQGSCLLAFPVVANIFACLYL